MEEEVTDCQTSCLSNVLRFIVVQLKNVNWSANELFSLSPIPSGFQITVWPVKNRWNSVFFCNFFSVNSGDFKYFKYIFP